MSARLRAVPVMLRPDSQGLPSPELADAYGVVAIGGDLSTERLLLAYSTGIFPWYSEGLPIHWHSPNPRYVLFCRDLQVNRSLSKSIRRGRFVIRFDTAFEAVIRACAAFPRPGQSGTWITSDMIAAYAQLHAQGHAHSVEAWLDGKLVGGAYGVCVGRVFCGESMFAHEPDASKIAFVHLVRQLVRWGVELVDCQVPTEHLERFGAQTLPRARFLALLGELAAQPPPPSPWRFDEDFDALVVDGDADDDFE